MLVYACTVLSNPPSNATESINHQSLRVYILFLTPNLYNIGFPSTTVYIQIGWYPVGPR